MKLLYVDNRDYSGSYSLLTLIMYHWDYNEDDYIHYKLVNQLRLMLDYPSHRNLLYVYDANLMTITVLL